MDCEMGQGYYFARPLPAENISLLRYSLAEAAQAQRHMTDLE